MEAVKTLWNLVQGHFGKVALVFVLGGLGSVIGLVPGTENVSNIIGQKITDIKVDLGTAAPRPTVVR